MIQQHQTILDAVKARNRKAAAQAMRDHLQQTEQDLRAHLQRTPYEQVRAAELEPDLLALERQSLPLLERPRVELSALGTAGV